MTTTKTTRLTLLLLFVSSVTSQGASGYSVTQGINCFGKEYVCVGPLNYKHCEWDAQGNSYAAGNVILCPSNHRCVNDGVEICIPLKLSTTAPLITSEQIHVNSISTEDPIKIRPLKWESTSAIPDTTTDIVFNKEPSSIPVDTTTAEDGSIWTTFLTESPNAYNTLGIKLADTNISISTSQAMETTTDGITETTTFQDGTTTTSDIYTTLTTITSGLPIKPNNPLEAGSMVDVTHISMDEIALTNKASETTIIQNIPSDPNFTDNYYSTISTPESSDSITDVYPRTIITESVGQYVPFETKTPIDAYPTIFSEGSTGTSPISEPIETATLVDKSIAFDYNAPFNRSESNIQQKSTVGSNSPVNENTSSHPNILASPSLPVEHNSSVDPNIPIDLSSSIDLNVTTIPVDETNTVIPNPSSAPSTPASSSLPVEPISLLVSYDSGILTSSNVPVENNSPMDSNIPIDLSSSTEPNATTIPSEQTNTVNPSSNLPEEPISSVDSSDPSTLASPNLPILHNSPVNPNNPIDLSSSTDPNATTTPADQKNTAISSLPVESISSVISSDHGRLTSSNIPVQHNSLVDSNFLIDLISTTDPIATTISMDQTNTIIPNPSPVPSTPASSSLTVEPISSVVSSDPNRLTSSNFAPVDPNNPMDLISTMDPNATTIPVDQTNTIIPFPSPVPSTPAISSLPVEPISSVVSPDPSTLASPNLPIHHNSPVDHNDPIDLSSSTDTNATTISLDQTNRNIPSISSDSCKPASPSLAVEPISSVVSSDPSTLTSPNSPIHHNSPVHPNNPIYLSSSTDANATTISSDQTNPNIPSISSDTTKPVSSSLPVKLISSVVSSDLSTLTSSNFSPVDPNNSVDLSSPTDPKILIDLSSSTGRNAISIPLEETNTVIQSDPSIPVISIFSVEHNSPANIPVEKTKRIIPSTSSDANSPASSSLPVNPDISKKLNASIDPNAATIPNIPSVASDHNPAISRAPAESNSSPTANPNLHNSPLNDTNQFGIRSPVASVKLRSSKVNPNRLIDSNESQQANINIPTDSSASTGLNKPVDHTSAIHSSDIHTSLTKWYLYSRNKVSNKNEESKHPLVSRRPTSTKKPNHQGTIKAESIETNSSKSELKDDASIEEKSNSNSKKSKKQKNSRNSKREEETVEKEIVEKESSEISLPEKRQNKDTSVENKSGANSKESKDSKHFLEENVKVDRKPDDEDDESASSEQKELIKKILKKIKDNKCDEDDVYPDLKDCKKYYRCVKKNHKTKFTHLRCENGDRFDSDKLKCINKRKAKCFSKEDFIEEFS